ncbi:MAG: zinc-binding dehydrogenase, partial [Chloroflexi bacterium]
VAGFAEKVVVHRSQVVKMPPDMPLDRASLLACGVLTGVGAVTNTARVPAGSRVVVIGAGGVGLNCIQGAYLSGAQTVIAVDLAPNKLTAARTFGATHTVNAGQEDVLAAVRTLTGGRGADYVFVAVGSGRAMEQGLSLLGRGGALVVVGMPADGVKMAVEVACFAGDSQRILGSKMGSARPGVDIPRLAEYYRQGRLKLDELISATYPLEDINEAIAAVKRGQALRNVIVF